LDSDESDAKVNTIRSRSKRFSVIRLFATMVAWPLLGGAASCSPSAATPAQTCTHRWTGTAVALTHATPLSQLAFGEVGYCADDPVTVSFTQGTNTVTLGATSAAPLQVSVPPWFDGVSGTIGNADTTVTVRGPDGAHALSGSLHIDALAPDTSGQPAGNRSLAVLASVTAAVTDARSRLSAFQGDTTAIDTAFGTMLTGLSSLTSNIQQVQSTGTPIAFVKVPSGATAMLTSSSLATMDALFVAALGSSGAPQSSAATAADDPTDPAWFQSMVSDVTTGSLASIQSFAGTVGSVIGVMGLGAVVLGVEAAAAPLELMAALVYVTTTFAPAASALVIDFAASAVGDGPEGPTSSEAWETAAPALQYVVLNSISEAVGELTEDAIEPASPAGAWVYDIIDNSVGISDGIAQKVVNVIWGNGPCPNGATPTEISFNPDSTTCPQASPSPTEPSGDGTNVCFVGAGTTAAWNQACATLNAKDTQIYNCLDPSSGPGLGAPQLPDGSSPSAVCVQFTDSSGVGTPLGAVTGCNPADPGYTECWCCPG